MPVITDKKAVKKGEPRTGWQRLAWFLALYVAGFAVVGGLAAGLKALVGLAFI